LYFCRFKSKYHPKVAPLWHEELKKEVSGNWEAFVSDLKSGVFDELSLDQPKEGKDEMMDISVAGDEEEENRIPMQNSVSFNTLPTSLQKAAIATDANTLLIKTLPPKITREELLKVASQITGFTGIAFGEPNQLKNFYRVAWVRLDKGKDAQAAADFLESNPVSEFRLHVGLPKNYEDSRIKYCPIELGQEDRLRRDLSAIKKIAEKLETRYSCGNPFDLNEEWRVIYFQVDPELDSIVRVRIER
jgi:hypothetical protein